MMKQTIFAITAGLILSACGGGSSSEDTTPPPTIVQVPQCGTATDLGKANAQDVTGKTINKLEDGAEVRIWHSPDATKLACMITGEATIVDN